MTRLGRTGLFGFGALCKVFAFSVTLTLAMASAAFADQVTNRIDTPPDAALESLALDEGATQTVAFRVVSKNGDDENGCNIDAGEQLKVQVLSSNPSAATVSPRTLTFTACDQDQSVTVAAGAKGTSTITVALAPGAGSNTTGSGSYDYTPASFTTNVNNVPPTISDITNWSTDEDTSTGAITFTVGDAGTPADDLTATGSSSNTTLVPNANIVFGGSGANRTVNVTPAANRSGTATVTVSVSDGTATTSDIFVLTVNARNDAPNAGDDTANADEGGANETINVLANDGDVDGNALAVTGNTQPPAGEGSVACSNANCTFMPDADFNGTTGFDYAINDGNGGTDTATVTVDVAATNDAPAAADDTLSTDEDEALTVGAPGILDNDSDVDDLLGPPTTLTAVLADGPDDGTLTLEGDGSFTYTPRPDFNGSDSFIYRADDGTIVSDHATVNLDVSPVNDAPDFDLPANPDQTVDEDAGAQAVGNFATNISPGPAGESSQAVSFAVTDDNNALFSERPAISPNGTLTYTPEPDSTGTATVMVAATDDGGTGLGGEDTSAPQSFTITVNAVNDIPTVSLDGAANADEGETKAYSFTADDPDPGGFTVNGGFPDCGAGGNLVAGSLTTTATGGDFRCRFPDGPASPSVRVQVADTGGAESNIATLTVAVANVAPSVSLGGPATAGEGDTKTYSFAVADPGDDSHSVATACGANGVKVPGSDNYNASTKEGDFRCRFPDGPATSSVTARANDSDGFGDADDRVVLVTVDNVAPVAQTDGPYATDEDEALSVGAPGVLGNDEDAGGANDVLAVTLARGPDHGSVALEPDGSFAYTPQADYDGADSFAYEVCDDAPVPLCDVGTANITVTAVEDAPTISGMADTATDDDTATGDIPFTVSDVDTAIGNLTVSGSSSNATLVPNANIVFGGSGANRTVNVTPAPDQSGVAEIALTVSDGKLEATEAFSLTVRDVTPPHTILDLRPPRFTSNDSASFSFSSEAGTTFECGLDSGAYEPCASPKTYPGLAQGQHAFRVRAIDVAGNVDPSPISRTWTVDSAAPTGTVSVNGGASYTNRAQVVFALEASDPAPGSGVTSMRFRENPDFWSSWEPYAASKSWTLHAADGKKSVFVQYKDHAGNRSTARATLILDSVAPEVGKVTPRDGAKASTDISVTAKFSEAINADTLSKSTVELVKSANGKPVPATVGYDPATEKMILKPVRELQPDASYTVSITGGAEGVEDLAGNALAASVVWQFRVE